MIDHEKEMYLTVQREDINRFIQQKETENCSKETVKHYARALNKMYSLLSEDKRVYADTLSIHIGEYLGEYSISTLNAAIAAYNAFMNYMGHKEFCADHLKGEKPEQPVLTRAEYLRLLRAAKRAGEHKTYLFIKLFGNTELNVSEVGCVTVEALKKGRISVRGRVVSMNDLLRRELLAYAKEEGIIRGPVFRTKNGKIPNRSNISKKISDTSTAAHVEMKKANPRALKRMYMRKQRELHEDFMSMIEQSYLHMMVMEESAVAWDTSNKFERKL